MTGPTLFDEPDSPLEAAFRAFHSENPKIYGELVRLARQAKMRGVTRWGVKALFEVLRWDRMMRTTASDFKLNNNLTASYAREIMRREPDLADFFETRETRAEREDDAETC